jgi:hypothetical protein
LTIVTAAVFGVCSRQRERNWEKHCEYAEQRLAALIIWIGQHMQGLDQRPVQTSMISLSLSPREQVDYGNKNMTGGPFERKPQ